MMSINWAILLSKDEINLYKNIQRSISKSVVMLFVSQLSLFIICVLLFINKIPLTTHLVFVLLLALIGGVMIAHNRANSVRKTWKVEHSINQSLPVILSYTLALWLWWHSYFITLMLSASDEMFLILVMVSTLGALNISIMGLFHRIFIGMIVSEMLTSLLMIAHLFGTQGQVYFLQVIVMGAFHYLLLPFQNKRILDNLYSKARNIELLKKLTLKNLELEHVSTSQSRYLSAASHDLRQPLHALSLIANDLERKNQNPEIAQSLVRVNQALESLSESFNAMLNISRLDSDGLTPQISIFPVNQLFSRLQIEYESMANAKGIRLHFIPSTIWVESDPGMLFSILSNFVSNAIRYTEKGGVLVGIRGGRLRPRLCVYDTGIGIDSSQSQSVFQEYMRLDYAKQRVTGGVGLGLSIALRMANLLHSTIDLKSIIGQGTAFSLSLRPIDQSNIAETSDFNEPKSDNLTGKTVLVFEDNDLIVNALSALLGSWGMQAYVLNGSHQISLHVQEHGAFDLIITDFHLGIAQETGLDILRKAYDEFSHIHYKSVLITGDTTGDLYEITRTEHINILHKPIRPNRLRSYLNNLMNAPTL
ncbi:MAG: rcsC [Burkholderiaceae bacterium]|nr:rcsC [Burkholderiaceae bacterium]